MYFDVFDVITPKKSLIIGALYLWLWLFFFDFDWNLTPGFETILKKVDFKK